MKVVVLGDYRQTISVVRSMARAGHEVIVFSDRGLQSASARSRYAARTLVFGPDSGEDDITQQPASPISEAVALLAREPAGQIAVFPVGEAEIEATLRSRAFLKNAGALVIAAPDDVALDCLDKNHMHKLASEELVPRPRSLEAENGRIDRDAWFAFAASLGYRCVIKPALHGQTIGGQKAVLCDNEQQALAALDLAIAESHSAHFVIQERIDGFRHNFQFASRDGLITDQFEQRVLRTDRLDGTGYCVDGVSVPIDPLVRDLTARLVARLRYTGVGCAQYLLADSDRRPYFLELNPRLDANCELAVACGIDFPKLALELALTTDPAAALDPATSRALVPAASGRIAPYPAGRRLVWTTGDVFGLLHSLNHREITAAEAIAWFARIVISSASASRHATWSWSDPGPALSSVSTRLQRASRGVARRVGRRLGTTGLDLSN